MEEQKTPQTDIESLSAKELEFSGLMRLAQSGDGDAYETLLNKLEKLLRAYVTHALVRAGLNTHERK
jgi:hypothetical protein